MRCHSEGQWPSHLTVATRFISGLQAAMQTSAMSCGTLLRGLVVARGLMKRVLLGRLWEDGHTGIRNGQHEANSRVSLARPTCG